MKVYAVQLIDMKVYAVQLKELGVAKSQTFLTLKPAQSELPKDAEKMQYTILSTPVNMQAEFSKSSE